MGELVAHLVVLGYVWIDEASSDKLPDHTNDFVVAGKEYSGEGLTGLEVEGGGWPAVSRTSVAGMAEVRRIHGRVLLEADILLDQHQGPYHGCLYHCVESVMTLASVVDLQAPVGPRACQSSSATCQ